MIYQVTWHCRSRMSADSIPARSRMKTGSRLILWSLSVTFCLLGSLPVQAADEPSARSLIEQARQFEQAQQYADAIVIYRTLLREDPENDDIRAALAKLLSWQGAHAKAISLYREIVQRHPADLDVRTALARVLSWDKQYDSAIQQYESVLREDGTNREALQGLADTLFWSGAHQEALQQYARLYQLTGDEAVAARMRNITAGLEASPQAPLGLRDTTIRLPFRDYLKVGYGQYSYSRGIQDERTVLFEAAKSLGAQTLIARIEPVNRFGFHDTVLSAEGYSPLWRRAWGYLAAQGTVNPDFSPKYSVAGEVSQGLGLVHPVLTMFEASFGYRYLSYKTDDIHLLSPGITVFLPFNLWLTEKLYYVPVTGAITLSSRLTWRPTNRLQIFASGSFGTSGERILATQDVTRVSSRTIQGGIVLPVADRVSLEVTGYDEDRGALYTRRGGSFSIIYHW